MSGMAEYALPLFALIDRSKIDLGQPLPESLAEQLRLYLQQDLGIGALSARLMVLGDEPYLILEGVASDSVPALLSLADVQRTQLFRYERTDEATVNLVPVNVRI